MRSLLTSNQILATQLRDFHISATMLRLSVKGNLERSESIFGKVTFVPKWMFRQVFRFVTYLQRSLFRMFVGTIVGVVTAVIIDPAVNRAFANAMKDGLNMFLTQPQIK